MINSIKSSRFWDQILENENLMKLFLKWEQQDDSFLHNERDHWIKRMTTLKAFDDILSNPKRIEEIRQHFSQKANLQNLQC